MMSAKAAQLFTLSATTIPSLSLAPFLYQTRTLSDINWTRLSRRRVPGIYPRRTFSSKPRYQYASDHNDIPQLTTAWTPLARTTVPVRTTIPDASKTSSRDLITERAGHLEWTQVERDKRFLDGIRPDLTSSRRDGTSTRREEHIGTDDFSGVIETQPIDFDENIEERYLTNRDEIADLTRSHPLGESTITDTERYAFQKIFKDIFGKNQGSATGIEDAFGSALPSKDADKAKSKHKAMSTTSRNNNMSRYEMEDMVNRYPAPLRAAAARAIGLAEVEAEGEEDIPDEEPELDMEKVEMMRQPERLRVETLMKDAATDFDLWKVMETEVFSLVSSLGLQDVEKPVERPKKIKSRSKEFEESVKLEPLGPVDAAQLQKFSTNKDGVSPLSLYGPLYPSYLLLGLRLLDRSFAKSSPLTLTLLPKIKSLGLISHVLGASSQLYNELLQIHRYRYDDYRGILQLLSEMEHSGIEFDQETLDIVQDIQRAQISARKGEKGPAIQVLWSLPEFAPNKFKVWCDKIGGDIRSRTMAQRTTMRY